jgi:aspartyl protease family protein
MSSDDPYGSPGGALGWAFRQLAIWGGIGLVVYAGVANRASFQSAPAAPAVQTASREQPHAAAAIGNSLVYHADQRGHVVLEAAVNGAATRFLVDTGASFVALTTGDAAAAGLGRGDLSFSAAISTANGVARAAPVRLREVRIGQLALENVQAMVVENLNISLLGQSFLKRLDSYEMRDGVLTITWN